jgi:hypothetical protein
MTRLQIGWPRVLALACGALVLASPVARAASCDKSCLERVADQYRAAYLKHDPRAIPLANHVRFSENGVSMAFPDASWDTVTRETGPATTISDVKTGQVGIYTAILQNDTPGFLAIRLQVKDGRITAIEHMLTTRRNLSGPPTPIGELDTYKPNPRFATIVPPAQRLPRERLVKHATGYFDTLQRNTGEIRGTCFAPGATRIENGRLYTDIEAGFRRGYYRFNDAVRREHLLVDEERQVVMSRGFIDHKGVLDEYTTTDGEKIRSPYREPHTWAFLEMFKVEGDCISGVQAVFIHAPYHMESPWKK